MTCDESAELSVTGPPESSGDAPPSVEDEEPASAATPPSPAPATVTWTTADAEPPVSSSVAVTLIRADPVPTAVTTPACDTVATCVFELWY
jgi:hypothetical protein